MAEAVDLALRDTVRIIKYTVDVFSKHYSVEFGDFKFIHS